MNNEIWKIIKKENKEKGWIYLGELIFSDVKFTPTSSNMYPWYLYTKYSNDVYYYAIDNGLNSIGHCDMFKSPTPISIIGFLKRYISSDRVFYQDDKSVMQLSKGFKIKLSGMSEWIEPDEEYYSNKITGKQLEEKLESGVINKLKEKAVELKIEIPENFQLKY